MKRKILINLGLFMLVLLVIGAVALLTDHFKNLPQRLSQQETIILGQNKLVPGSQAGMRILVRDSRDSSPLADTEIIVSMRPAAGGDAIPLYTGRTSASGVADIVFRVPEQASPDQTLLIETKSSLGSETVERPVTLQRDYRVLLTTDKPIYQPGQLIHLRALALSTFDLVPAAGQEVEVTIADGKGNKVFRTKLTTDEYGVCFTDFQLASEVNTGNYKISVTMGNTSSEKTVAVENYVLPKFKVTLETEKSYYLPSDHVRGTLTAVYFYGKPIAGGQVTLEGYTFDVERSIAFTLQGTTNEEGVFEFEFDLPEYLTGIEFDKGQGRFYVQAGVTDLAQHTETSNLSMPISAQSLFIDAVPESGVFRPGVENILYIMTSYPDGTPADTDLTVNLWNTGQVMNVSTGEYGVAEVRFIPNDAYQSLQIVANDKMGNGCTQDFYWDGEYQQETILLRPEKPVYLAGQTMNLTILTSQQTGTVYLDILREGQTISMRSAEVENGKVEMAVDITPDMFGTLQLSAYKIMTDGQIVRDTRLVAVNSSGADLIVNIKPGQETYRPGDEASLNVLVQGLNMEGAQAALGLAIVDESVFALANEEAGFAKLYFLLESQILTPRYDLHGFSVPEMMNGISTNLPEFKSAISDTAQASLAAATPRGVLFSLQANSHQDALNRANTQRSDFFKGLNGGANLLFYLVPLALIALTLLSIWRDRHVGGSLGLASAMLLGVFGFFFIVYTLQQQDYYYYYQTTEQRMFSMFTWLGFNGSTWMTLLLLGGIAGLVALAVLAIVKKDFILLWSLALVLAFEGLLYLIFMSINATGTFDGSLTLMLIALFTAPFAFFLRSASSFFTRKTPQALASLAVAASMLMVSVPVTAYSEIQYYNMNGWQAEKDMLFLREAAMPMAGGAEAPQVQATMVVSDQNTKGETDTSTPNQANEPPRLRQYFPETMLWLPDAVTDENGQLTIPVTAADSITTWRITALASTKDGRIGATQGSLRVFQDFFIDLDLPLALTVGDEVSIPVGVFNYLPDAQSVRLELEQSDWYTLLDDPVKEITIQSNEISVVYFRVRAEKFGIQPFQVTAYGSQMSDAIRKEVRVYPQGKLIPYTYADRLTPGQNVSQSVIIPADAIPGTQKLLVKIYPGILSQVVEGLDSILQMPYGCFEQTSSTTYPNVLVLDYLKATGQTSPETQMKAEEYINLGYQRLTTFEVEGGGFSLFGDAPADRMLTAYGLQEFSDMSKVYQIDPAFIDRAAQWLLNQQSSDGTWENDQGLVHETTWSSLGDDRLPVTAYIVWSLVEAGYEDDPRTVSGIQFVREHANEAEDPYVLALVASALTAADLKNGGITPATQGVLDKLAGLAKQDGDSVYWESSVATFMGSQGQSGSIETTAMAALVFLKADAHPDLVNGALSFIIRSKDPVGTWYTTQATVLSLKALIQSVRSGAENINATVTVSLNGSQLKTLTVNKDNFDVVQMLSFSDINIGSGNVVEITSAGEGNLMYQVSGSFYLPWEKLPQYADLVPATDLVTIDLAYDRAELSVNDTVTVKVKISLNQPGARAESALIDLGLPPGFAVMTEDLDALIGYYNDVPQDYAFAQIQRYEMTGRQLMVYITNLEEGKPLEFTYRLRAKFPLKVQAPASTAYDYYNPDVQGEQQPVMLVVNP